jgi:glucose-6-phosphate isomerase
MSKKESKMYLNIDFETGLLSKELQYWVPHDASPAHLEKIVERWQEGVNNPNNSFGIFSGYKRQVLEKEGLLESLKLAQDFRARFKHLVVLGIGGSALGTRAVWEALSHTVSDSRFIHILDNLDPVEFERIWKQLPLKETAFAVISKSGGTLETMAQCSLILSRLQEAGVDYKQNIVAITDPSGGALRKWVNETGMASLSVPSDVGGRFSVFTPVGLFPLAFAGLDVEKFLKGADQLLKGEVLSQKNIAQWAQRLAEYEWEGFAGHVMMPYSTVLKNFSAWFVQLWGESLGKESARGQHVGSIPVAAVGATDQHSILQLLVEGPNRIITGFVSVKDWNLESEATHVMTSSLPDYFDNLSFARNSSFARILDAQSKATQSVLVARQRPSYRIELGKLDEEHLGALLALYMELTSATGAALGIQPYDQPGVEEGKQILPRFF